MAAGNERELTSVGAVTSHILLVEDDEDDAKQIAECLKKRGHRVSIAKDGGQAQSSFLMQRPDFVILDLILTGESGYEVCDRLKRNDSHIPVLVLSAIDMDDSRDLASRVGADGYLTKPFDPDVLTDEIARVAHAVWEKHHVDGNGETKPDRIRFKCQCGKKFKVSPVHAGRTMTCGDCAQTVIVPRAGG